MIARLTMLGLVLGCLAGCGPDSRLNPANWGQAAVPETLVPASAPRIDRRALVDRVVDVRVDETTGGAILRAEGIAAADGYHGAALVFDAANGAAVDGVLSFTYRIEAPRAGSTAPAGSRRSTAAVFLSDQTLAGVRQLRVIARQNEAIVRR